jgi:DUF1680 family protein
MINLTLAVLRGPIVYCLEAQDASNSKLDKVLISASTKFSPVFNKSLLGGVTVLKGTALYKNENETNNSMQLYKEVKSLPAKTLNIQLVPYYSWNNRGIGEMAVWLPQTFK